MQGERKITVRSNLILSMMDTKVINDLSGTSSQACSFCRKSGKALNDPEDDTHVDPEEFGRGFSPLHANIRTMELFLKIASRLCMEKPTWRVPKTDQAVRDREAMIRSELKQKLGLRIGEPLPGGGNSNDGNTARRLFKDWRTVCEITRLNKTLMERIYVILVVINDCTSVCGKSFRGNSFGGRAYGGKSFGRMYHLAETHLPECIILRKFFWRNESFGRNSYGGIHHMA